MRDCPRHKQGKGKAVVLLFYISSNSVTVRFSTMSKLIRLNECETITSL